MNCCNEFSVCTDGPNCAAHRAPADEPPQLAPAVHAAADELPQIDTGCDDLFHAASTADLCAKLALCAIVFAAALVAGLRFLWTVWP